MTFVLRHCLFVGAMTTVGFADANPVVEWERDSISDHETTGVRVSGEWAMAGTTAPPSIYIRCGFQTMSEWNSEVAESYQTSIRIFLPGSKHWKPIVSAKARLDNNEPFSVDTKFLKQFERINLSVKISELLAASKLAIRAGDHTAIIHLKGLRNAMAESPNKCDWNRLHLPGPGEA